jgi:RNA polymerase sigma-54 factor
MLNLSQKLSQSQRLSPQQIQYIKLLQLPTLALEQRIKAEMEINPLLEEGEEVEEEFAEDSTEEHDFDDVVAENETSDDEYDWEEFMDQMRIGGTSRWPA